MTELVLNKNFYNYANAILFGGFSNNQNVSIGTVYTSGRGYHTSNGGDVQTQMKTTSGGDATAVYFGTYSAAQNNWNHSFFYFNVADQGYNGGVYFGGGSDDTTPATIDDTNLISPNSNITATILNGERESYTSILYTVQFSASSEQVLSEVGLFRSIYSKVGNSTTYYNYLLGRCKLDNPITLDAGNSVTLQIRISLPIPQ